MIYTAYEPATGQILWTYTDTDESVIQTEINGKPVVTGEYSPAKYYIDAGVATELPAKPASLLNVYKFDYATKTWQVDVQATGNAVRKIRDEHLSSVDRVNPIWYGTLTTEQQQQLQQYRSDLLNIPQQSGFPESVVWPTKPAWL